MFNYITAKTIWLLHLMTSIFDVNLIRRPPVLVMVYCSNVEMSEEPSSERPTTRFRHLAILR